MACRIVPLPPRTVGKCREESAEAIVARTTTGEGPNLVLRAGTFAVRVTADIGGRAGMRGADAAGTGRNPEKGCMSMSTHPWAEGSSVPEQAQLMERVVERPNMVRADFHTSNAGQVWTGLNMRNRRGT